MKRRWLVGVIVIAGLSGFLAASALGRRATFNKAVELTRGETQNNLRSAVDTLAYLRNGDCEEAIKYLEGRLDAALETVPRHTEWSELPGMLRHSYMSGKAYRTAYPAEEPSEELEHALNAIPLPDTKNLSPALRDAVEAANVVESPEQESQHGTARSPTDGLIPLDEAVRMSLTKLRREGLMYRERFRLSAEEFDTSWSLWFQFLPLTPDLDIAVFVRNDGTADFGVRNDADQERRQ